MAEVAQFHYVNVFDHRGFLHRMMSELAGDALISFEGALSHCTFDPAVVVARDEHGLLKRSTDWPKVDFVVLKLETLTTEQIFKQIDRWRVHVRHVQIEKAGTLQLVALNNFQKGNVITGPLISRELLDALMKSRVIYEVEPTQQTP